MKITVGLGSIDDYIDYAKSGADEVFVGFVPFEWLEKYSNITPLNRREVLYYNVSIGTYEDLTILYEMYKKYKVEVSFTFNALYYTYEQCIEISKYIENIRKIGFKNFIIADIGLILYLKKNKKQLYENINIHLSGEFFEYNTMSLELIKELDIKRYIFHRKCSYNDIKKCIKKVRAYKKDAEFEAFIMNENCHYTGAYCNSIHCDELVHLCTVEYELGNYDMQLSLPNGIADTDKMKEVYTDIEDSFENEQDYVHTLGETGCGLCAIMRLEHIGITNLKIVGRGAHTECIKKDIEATKKCLNILDNMLADGINDEEKYRRQVLKEIFNNKCLKNCYYNEE